MVIEDLAKKNLKEIHEIVLKEMEDDIKDKVFKMSKKQCIDFLKKHGINQLFNKSYF